MGWLIFYFTVLVLCLIIVGVEILVSYRALRRERSRKHAGEWYDRGASITRFQVVHWIGVASLAAVPGAQVVVLVYSVLRTNAYESVMEFLSKPLMRL